MRGGGRRGGSRGGSEEKDRGGHAPKRDPFIMVNN